MTVRTWFTISAIALIAMSLAAYFRLTTPSPPPEILARSGDARLHGYLGSACWPRRGGKIACERHGTPKLVTAHVRTEATIQLAAFPVEPKSGRIDVTDSSGATVFSKNGWTRTLRMDLKDGRYVLRVDARYTSRTYVSWLFPFSVTRSGS